MSIALYRKYRPATFGEVRGQEHVTDPLRQALRNGRINHAYLFSGPRGCGKTSSARILARSLNCEQGPTPDPCGQCDSCVALAPDGGGSIDVIEIDAASHGGVDDARDLRERAFFSPVGSRYKVYIIDEAHMVTREGFNALLKLVEEPPPHLKFVFATTEPEKVIGTIRSRTHHYPFRLIPPSTLRELMEQVLTDEGVTFDPAALPLVVRAGAGSARDSLSILDQLLAGSGDDGITREGAVALLGYTDSGLLGAMVDALGARDGAAAFELIDRMVEGGHDPRRFTADLLERTRDLVVLAAVPDALQKGLINVPPDDVETMREQAARLGPAALTRAAEVLNTGLTEMRGATSPRLLLELLCARVLLPGAESGGDTSALLTRLEQVEHRVASGAVAAPQPTAAPPPAAVPPAPQRRASEQPAPQAASQPVPQPEPDAPQPSRADVSRETPADAAPRPSGVAQDDRPQQPQRPESSGPQRPSADDWDAPSASGGGQAAPRQAATGGGALNLGTVQSAWGRIMEAVKQGRRFTWMILTANNVTVMGVEGNQVQLGFERPNDARGFSNSGSDKVVAEAIRQVLGAEVRVTAAAASGPMPPPPAQRPASPPPAEEPVRWDAEPRQPEPQQSRRPDQSANTGHEQRPPAPERPPDIEPPDDFGPPPEDFGPPDDLPPDRGTAAPSGSAPPAAPNAEEEAPGMSGIALLQSELGGTVIEEIDHQA
ncbi:DNA polymerase-3 subunit gamma/tau [Murinocardiopsis flavida]|uniref:DNA polymerase III subunit gamma/tau n=1 Tax=Murinocardiopsis flavida TaxID=645275 RepID=A0A2P8DE01_9ACTN|nr:DNA polymerase III subunit gamma and tau [Murinocardiopsis flavida]PSK95454.1 DNA polymerase-3 subunit gamma/tau [Murinocardiopsis flavida]